MPWYMEAWDWIKDHPYIAGGGAIGVVGGYLLLHRSGTPTSPLSAQQQYNLQRLQLQTNSPLAIARLQARATTAQANAAARAQIAPATAEARSQTAIARAGLAASNLATRLQSRLGMAQISAGTTQAQQANAFQLALQRLMGQQQSQQTTQANAFALAFQRLFGGQQTQDLGITESVAQELGLAGFTSADYAHILAADQGLGQTYSFVPPTYSPISFGLTSPTMIQ